MQFRGFFGVLKTYWLPILVIAVVAVLFVSSPILIAYRTLRSKVPGASSILPAK